MRQIRYARLSAAPHTARQRQIPGLRSSNSTILFLHEGKEKYRRIDKRKTQVRLERAKDNFGKTTCPASNPPEQEIRADGRQRSAARFRVFPFPFFFHTFVMYKNYGTCTTTSLEKGRFTPSLYSSSGLNSDSTGSHPFV